MFRQHEASIETLRLRALWLKRIRTFFETRSVLEVETPVLSSASVPDPNIESLQARVNGLTRYLQTSPELYMKRLLATGSGPIYQTSRVFRDGEAGRFHNPEFTLVEWYQPEYSLQQLMDEVVELVFTLCEIKLASTQIETIGYRELFEQTTGINPLQEDWDRLDSFCISKHLECPIGRDDWVGAMDWLLSIVIQPRMQGFLFVIDYPASQASLARLDPENPAIARRFELFIDGVEMANGFEELTDATEQRRRFENDNVLRTSRSLSAVPLDENFLAALQSGLPETAGVALGFDRLLMWKTGASMVYEVMSFAD